MSSGKKEAPARTEAQFNDEDGEVTSSSCAYDSIMQDGKQVFADESEQNTRKGNTGVSHTEPLEPDKDHSEPGLSHGAVTIDWLSWTLPTETWMDVIRALEWCSAVLGEFVPSPRGFAGYELSAHVLGKGRIGYSQERPENGVYVSLPSSALATLAELDEDVANDPRGFLRFLLESEIVDGEPLRMKRIDPACDDRRGDLDLEEIDEKLEKRHYVSPSRKRNKIDGYDEGVTFYVGSRTSDTFLRVYDKQKLEMLRGEPDPGRWTRVELEAKRARAQVVTEALVARGLAVLPAIILAQIEFKEPSEDDSNKSRWQTSLWWQKFLGFCERLVLQLPPDASTLEDKEDWIWEMVAPLLSTVFEWRGSAVGYLLALVEHGKKRRSPLQRALLEAAQAAERSKAVAA